MRQGDVGLIVGLIIAVVLLATLTTLLVALLRKKKRDASRKPEISAVSEDSVPELGSREARLQTLSQLAKSPSLTEDARSRPDSVAMRKLGAQGELGTHGAPEGKNTPGLADNELDLEKLRAGRGSAAGGRLGSQAPGSGKAGAEDMKYSVQALEDTERLGRMDREGRGAGVGSALGPGSFGEGLKEDSVDAKINDFAEEFLGEKLGTSQRKGRAGIRPGLGASGSVLGDGAAGGLMKRQTQKGKQGKGELGKSGAGLGEDDIDLILDDTETDLNQMEREENEKHRGKHRGGKLRRERARVNGLSANIGLTPIKMGGSSGPALRKSKNAQ